MSDKDKEILFVLTTCTAILISELAIVVGIVWVIYKLIT